MKFLLPCLAVLLLVTACISSSSLNSSPSSPILEKPEEGQIWLYKDTIQCMGNPWEQNWWSDGNYDDYPSTYPRYTNIKEKPIIVEYYQKQGISIERLKRGVVLDENGNPAEDFCESCKCQDGVRLYVLVSDTPEVVNSMALEDWKQV